MKRGGDKIDTKASRAATKKEKTSTTGVAAVQASRASRLEAVSKMSTTPRDQQSRQAELEMKKKTNLVVVKTKTTATAAEVGKRAKNATASSVSATGDAKAEKENRPTTRPPVQPRSAASTKAAPIPHAATNGADTPAARKRGPAVHMAAVSATAQTAAIGHIPEESSPKKRKQLDSRTTAGSDRVGKPEQLREDHGKRRCTDASSDGQEERSRPPPVTRSNEAGTPASRPVPAPNRATRRFIPFSVSSSQALASFAEWKANLWFAPADFNCATASPRVEKVWVPYHTLAVQLEATLSATLEHSATQQKGARVVQISCELSGTERMTLCATGSEDERRLIPNIEDEETLALGDALRVCYKGTMEECTQEERGAVREEMDKHAFLRLVDAEIRKTVDKKGRTEMINQTDAGSGSSLKNTKIETLQYRIQDDISVLVPIYQISYTYGSIETGSSAAKQSSRRYVFLVNGTTNKYWGERPWGIGSVLSKGISALNSIFGTNDEDRIGIVEGSMLQRVDNCVHYSRESAYLVFPPSHSYLVTSASGWIKLKNNLTDHELRLLSWPRKGERSQGSYTLPPGEEEVFDFRGRWCIEVKGRAEGLEVIGFDTTGGGRYGNKLNMHYEGLL